jgi:hypothetical protein
VTCAAFATGSSCKKNRGKEQSTGNEADARPPLFIAKTDPKRASKLTPNRRAKATPFRCGRLLWTGLIFMSNGRNACNEAMFSVVFQSSSLNLKDQGWNLPYPYFRGIPVARSSAA